MTKLEILQVDFELQSMMDHLKLTIKLLTTLVGIFEVFLKNSVPVRTFGKSQNDLQY